MKRSSPPRFVRMGSLTARMLAVSSTALLASHSAQAQNTADQYTGPATGSLLLPGNWSLGAVPLVTNDAVFTATTGIRALTAGDLTVGSFNVTATTGIFSIRNETSTATNSNLTLGGTGNLGNSVSGTLPADLLYAATGSTFNIIGPNTNGTGVLNLILDQSGNFNLAGTATISAAISDGGNNHAITKTGTGTLTLSGANTFTGGVTLAGGALKLGNATALGGAAGMFTINGGTLDSSSANLVLTANPTQTWNSDFTFTGTNSLNLGTGAVNLGATGSDSTRILTASANTLTLGGVISNGTNGTTTGLTKTGAGTLSLAGANTYTGTTTITAGFLKAGVAENTGVSGPFGVPAISAGSIIFNTGTLQYSGGNQFDYSDRFTTLNNKAYSIDTNGQAVTFATGLGASGTSGLTKLGTGTLTLSGNNLYTGATTVNAGTLLLDMTGSGALYPLSALTLGGGTFSVRGNTSGARAQTLGALSLTTKKGNHIVLDPNGGTSTTLTLGNAWTRGAGSSLLIDYSSANLGDRNVNTTTAITGTGAANNGILGYVLVKDSIGIGFGRQDVSFNIVRNTAAGTVLDTNNSVAGTITTDFTTVPTDPGYVVGVLTLDNVAHSANSLSIDSTDGGMLDLGGATGVLTLTTKALLMTGGGNYTIQNGTLGAPASEVIVHQTGAGTLTLSNLVSSGAGSLTKDGNGELTLYANNLFTGGVVLNAGTLNINAEGTDSTNSAIGSGTLVINDGTTISNTSGAAIILATKNNMTWNGSFEYAGAADTTKDLNFTGASNTGGMVTLTANSTVNVTGAGATLNAGINLSGAFSLTKNGPGTLKIGKGNGGLSFTGNLIVNEGTFGGAGNSGQPFTTSAVFLGDETLSSTKNAALTYGSTAGGVPINLTVRAGSSGSLGLFNNSTNSNGYTGTITLNNHLTLGAAIAGKTQTFATVISGGSGIKIGDSLNTNLGTVILTGVNTYSGDTTVNSGTLVLADNAGLKFVVTNASSNRLRGSGTVTLAGDFTIDTAAVSNTSGSWTLVDVTTLTATFGSTFSVAGWSETANVWTKNESGKTWTFTEATGVLTLTGGGGSGYDIWATTPPNSLSGGNAAFDFDYDNDGIDNGLEWILGGDPTKNDTPSILPAVTGSAATGLTLVFNRASTSVAETTLVVEWGSEPAAFANSLVIGTTDVPVNGTHPSVDIDAPATGQVTVHIPAANALGGKLFARLRATRND